MHREIKSIKQLAVSENKNTSAESKESGNNTNNITNKTNNKPSSSIPTPTPPSLDPSLLVEAGGLTDDRNELLLQLNLQKQKMELLAVGLFCFILFIYLFICTFNCFIYHNYQIDDLRFVYRCYY